MVNYLKIFLCILAILVGETISAQLVVLSSRSLNVKIDSTNGSLSSIINKLDRYQMNWIMTSDGSQYSWQTANDAWGLGYGMVNGDTVRWNKPTSSTIRNNQTTHSYQTAYFKLNVVRTLDQNGLFTESYQFTNTTSGTIKISDVAINTPFNDNYPDSKTCVESRCNAHIWAGDHSSYVFAERMGAEAPHLGLVLTQGSLKSYELKNRNLKPSGSNARGTILLNPSDITLPPKKSQTIKWVLFATESWNDFYTKAQTFGFVKGYAERYVIEQNQPLHVVFESNKKLTNVTCLVNGEKVAFTQTDGTVEVQTLPHSVGAMKVQLLYGNNQSTFVNVLRIESIDRLIAKRANFIVSNQQLNDTSDARCGAYMVYDNETHSIYKNNDKRKASDVNEGRERVGMGVFLAMYLQKHPDSTLQASLERYCRFVRYKLQRPDYSVPSSIDGGGRKRVYNYPWVTQLYLEMYQLTNQKSYLIDFYRTLRKYFVDSNHTYYAIGVPIQKGLIALKKEGMQAAYDSILADGKLTAENFLRTSLFYPRHEVNYEQSIVAPSVVFLLEMYQITNDVRYLKEGEKQLRALEAFGGNQPDYHLNNIALRHWDGYWFGKYKYWGDVMPHYWSTITSEAYTRYATITGQKDYLKRAETIVKNNLCNFFEDGSASCAYLFPAKVNERKAAFFDPFANDQDWALVYYLKFLRSNTGN